MKLLELWVIRACAVEELEEEQTFLIALCDDLENPMNGTELQSSLVGPDKQDVELEMDTYCVSLSSGATVYGGLSSCILDGKSFTLEFELQAAEVLGMSGLRLQLEISEEKRKLLSEGLERMFKNDARAPKLLLS